MERAEKLLDIYVNRYEKAIKKDFPTLPENKLAACTSFAYNCGLSAFRGSTLFKKIKANEDDETIPAEFQKWVKAAGKVMKGLVNRRLAEAALYISKK